MMQIHDPIHGYISLDGMYAHIVNTPEFQRLRSIEQVSFRPVYPGARHDRFLHSLGTYHLAGKFADCFFRNLKTDLNISLTAYEERRLKTTFRYAALLHDIGHAPFSHTTEDFFAEKKSLRPSADPVNAPYPQIWDDLCAAVRRVNQREGDLFFRCGKKQGASHEIMSATLLITNRKIFIPADFDSKSVDLALAARMVIGLTYEPNDLSLKPAQLGIRNCLIQLLNSKVLDVDRLDYMGRDTLMTGYSNAPLDLDCLAGSVTAIEGGNKLLTIAFRDSALAVFDLMFQAKLSHDAWVINSPAGAYEAALLAHCIRRMDDGAYLPRVFCRNSLGSKGTIWNRKVYRYLSDVDVSADLKARANTNDPDCRELFTRELGVRRTAAWRSYYEYHHIFDCTTPDMQQEKVMTPDKVTAFFKPLLNYLDKEKVFAFTNDLYQELLRKYAAGQIDLSVLRPASLLNDHLSDKLVYPDFTGTYSIVLLKRSNNVLLNLDPTQIFIVFSKFNIPLRNDRYNYSTYAALTGAVLQKERNKDYFYLFRHGVMYMDQLKDLRDRLWEYM